jgi:ComF family protein
VFYNFINIKSYYTSFLNLLFPNLCVACGYALAGNEMYVCTSCLANLPYTHFYTHKHNPVEEIFWGRVQVENAASYIFFEKGGHLQEILHQLKYKQKPEVGVLMGRLFGNKLVKSRFNAIDVIVPVPLHKSRQSKRGYNQSEMIANGIAQSMNKPVEATAVIRAFATKTQTSKSRFERWLNVDGVFKITKPEAFIGRHLLIVDDVVTTGATSESFIQEFLKIPGVKVSFVALGSV